jgi:hypothetical protein
MVVKMLKTKLKKKLHTSLGPVISISGHLHLPHLHLHLRLRSFVGFIPQNRMANMTVNDPAITKNSPSNMLWWSGFWFLVSGFWFLCSGFCVLVSVLVGQFNFQHNMI